MDIEVFTIGYKKDSLTCYGAVLTMGDNTFESAKVFDDVTKNQADVMAVTMALRCIKPEFRKHKVVLYSPPGYASKVLEQRTDGGWLSNPKSNLDAIQEARKTIELFSDIEVRISNKRPPAFNRCIELVKECQKNAN